MHNKLLQSVRLAISSGGQTEAMADIERVVDYIERNRSTKIYSEWDRDVVRLLIAYHLAKQTIVIGRDESGNVNACCTWYNCNEADIDKTVDGWHPDNPNGDSVYIDMAIADNTQTFIDGAKAIVSKDPSILSKKILMHRIKGDCKKIVKKDRNLFKKIFSLK